MQETWIIYTTHNINLSQSE